MKLNVGGIDRVARIVAGLGLTGAALLGQIGPWGFIGVIPLVTGAFGYCPLYTLLGLSTRPLKKG